MTRTASYPHMQPPGAVSATIGPSSSHLPLSVLDSRRRHSLPFATPAPRVLPHYRSFDTDRWADVASTFVTRSHLVALHSEFARVRALIDRATELDLDHPLSDLVIHTVATNPLTAVHWTVRTYALDETLDSSIPLLPVDDDFEGSGDLDEFDI